MQASQTHTTIFLRIIVTCASKDNHYSGQCKTADRWSKWQQKKQRRKLNNCVTVWSSFVVDKTRLNYCFVFHIYFSLCNNFFGLGKREKKTRKREKAMIEFSPLMRSPGKSAREQKFFDTCSGDARAFLFSRSGRWNREILSKVDWQAQKKSFSSSSHDFLFFFFSLRFYNANNNNHCWHLLLGKTKNIILFFWLCVCVWSGKMSTNVVYFVSKKLPKLTWKRKITLSFFGLWAWDVS